MKKKSLHVCCLLLLCLFGKAGGLQAQSVAWAKAIPMVGNQIAAGVSLAKDVETDAAGNVYIAGQFAGTHDFGGGPVTASGNVISTLDGFIAKYNSAGNFIWLETLPAFLGGIEDIEIDTAGNIYLLANFENQISIAGTTIVAGDSDPGVAFAKLNANRDLQWATSVKQVNTFNDVFGRTIEVGHDGRVFVTGIFTGTLTVGGNQLIAPANSGSNFLAALDGPTGFWEFSIAVANSSPLSTRLDVAGDHEGAIFLAGTSIGDSDFGGTVVESPDEQFAFLAKYDADGDLLWVRHSAGSSSSFSDESAAVEIAPSGDVYLGGTFGSDTFLLGGMTLLNPEICCSEFFVAKFTTDGNLLWVRQSQGPFSTEFELSDIVVSENGSVTATGVYINTMGFTVTLGPAVLPQGAGDNVFVVQYAATGALQWAKGIFAENTSSEGIAYHGDGSVILTGLFAGEFPLGGITLQSLPQDFSPNLYFLKLDGLSSAAGTVMENQRIRVYPNPARDHVVAELSNVLEAHRIRLTDALGRQVYLGETVGTSTTIELSNLPDGVYFLFLENTEGVVAAKKLMVTGG